MKLYHSPGSCSTAALIALKELGLPFDSEQVDIFTHKTQKGADYYRINPKGYVPALELDDGQVLTEGPAIAQYLADKKPDAKYLPAVGTIERYRALEWLTYIGTEIHQTYGPLWNPKVAEDVKKATLDKLSKRLEFVAKSLEGKQFLLGDRFTAPDAYLFVMLSWSKNLGPDMGRWPVLKTYFERVSARPSVKAAMEG